MAEPEGFSMAWWRFRDSWVQLWVALVAVLVALETITHATVNLGPEFVGTYMGLENPRRHTLGKWAVLLLLLFGVLGIAQLCVMAWGTVRGLL